VSQQPLQNEQRIPREMIGEVGTVPADGQPLRQHLQHVDRERVARVVDPQPGPHHHTGLVLVADPQASQVGLVKDPGVGPGARRSGSSAAGVGVSGGKDMGDE
jgi:hypothetical protein